MSDFENENRLFHQGFLNICGLDEVGRGALFGPVVAAAVILDPDRLHPDIHDSKTLTPAKRRVLASFIYSTARAYSIGWCCNDGIDEINILQATRRAMNMAVQRLQMRPDYLLVDGLKPDFCDIPGLRMIKGDQRSMSIAAASIIAKVFRDRLLEQFDPFFPEYDLARNKGYPTQKHKNMILSIGMTIFHRLSFKVRHEC
jgi:ribonuclease HII